MRFIHAADLHLDSPLSGLRDRAGERADDLAEASRRAFENMVDYALAERIDLVVIAGDVFDGDWADYESGLFLVRGLARLDRAGIRVVMIRGNHDAANQMSRRLSWPGRVRELSSRTPETEVIAELGVAVHGQSFPNRAVPENLVHAYPKPMGGLFNIGLLHTSADGRAGHSPYAPCTLADLALKGYDYWALGHVHTREVLSRDPWIVFPGNLQGRHVNEPGAKGFSVVTVEGGRVEAVEHVAVDVVRWATIVVDASGAPTLDELCPRIGEAIEAAAAAADGRTLAARLVIEGACPAHAALAGDPDRLQAECTGLALRSRGDVWLERVDVRTRPAGEAADEGALADFARLVAAVGAEATEAEVVRGAILRGLERVPPALFAAAGLDEPGPALFERIMAEAEATVVHRLAEAAGRP
jgi:predicted phosphodiesterase